MIKANEIFNRVEGMHTFEEVVALQRFAEVAPSGAVVNVGCYLGLSTVALASVREVYAVDPFEDVFISSPVYPDGYQYTADNLEHFKANVAKMGVADRVHLLRNKSEDEARRWRKPIALVLIDFDPNHATAAITAWGRFVVDGGYLLQHDINEPPVIAALEALEATGDWTRVQTVDLLAIYQRTGGGFREGVAAVIQEAVKAEVAKQTKQTAKPGGKK